MLTKKGFIKMISSKMKDELLFNSSFYPTKSHIDELYYHLISRCLESTIYTNIKTPVFKSIYEEITTEKCSYELFGNNTSNHTDILKVLESK